MLKEHFIQGGPSYMLPLLLMWAVYLFLVARILILYFASDKDSNKLLQLNKLNNAILFIGSFMFLAAILYQVLGMYQALSAIEEAGDISPALVFGGLKVSLIAPLYGFVFLLFTSVTWFLFRNILKK